MNENIELFDREGNHISLVEIMKNVYFDIPNSEMNYAVYSLKAYCDENGWFLFDSDGKKQYEDEKWLKVSSKNNKI
jgi:hypothetical protein